MRAWVLSVAAVALVAATPARAATPAEKTANQVFVDYTKDGRIDPCDYTTAQLQTALDNVEPNVVQYASDYPAAIKQALRFRARGGCDKDAAASPAPATSAPSSPAAPPATGAAASAPAPGGVATVVPTPPGVADPPGPDTVVPSTGGAPSDTAVERAAAASPDNDAPAPLVGLGLLAVLALLTVALWFTIRRLNRDNGPVAHSWREARWRAGGVWADFRDWLSLGR